jgi:hypothetical protein
MLCFNDNHYNPIAKLTSCTSEGFQMFVHVLVFVLYKHDTNAKIM